MQSAIDPDLQMIIDAMRGEFIAETGDKIDEIDTALDAIDSKTGRYENHVLEIKRIAHSIKGNAGSFGFPAITRIAHDLEEYIDVTSSHSRLTGSACRMFLQAMQSILTSGVDPDDQECAMILDSLPVPVQPGVGAATRFKGKALLLMPAGVQRKIIARELAAFGIRTTVFDDSLAALDFALSGGIDIAFVSQHMNRINGFEFAAMLAVLDRTQGVKVAVLSAGNASPPAHLPLGNTVVVPKGPAFARDILAFIASARLI